MPAPTPVVSRDQPGATAAGARPLVVALARYVEALHRRYPDGPEQMHRERLASMPDSANVIPMDAKREAGAA